MASQKKRRPSGRKTGGSIKKRLPGLKHVQTKSAHNRKKKLPREPENPVIDDGEMNFDRAPAVLNIDGATLWRRAVNLLRKVGELTSDDWFGLKTLCYNYQRMCKLERADQDIPTAMRRTVEKLLMEYGMTPAARLRMDPEGKTRQNGPPNTGFTKKAFEEQDIPMEGEEKEKQNQLAKLENRAAELL